MPRKFIRLGGSSAASGSSVILAIEAALELLDGFVDGLVPCKEWLEYLEYLNTKIKVIFGGRISIKRQIQTV